MITIVDYGASNLSSVAKAISHLGYSATVTSSPKEVAAAKVIVLPGVGAAGDTMSRLGSLGLIAPLVKAVREGKPFLGVCLGLQILFTSSEESGGLDCLNVLPGQVRRLPSSVKVPHIGWNQVRQKAPHDVFKGIPDEAHFYFVHSYYADPDDRSLVVGETEYGVRFASAVARGNLVATQFHPEKSGDWGLMFYRNFFRFAGVR
ncbi:MAG: imidazole glycerol phosphate synthase amidotransferase subunit [Dehalococcoidia bacterium]|nr:imidazole glycerol phosphate synthase amidotransferase subunit [Dehalococcoidia bacterium]